MAEGIRPSLISSFYAAEYIDQCLSGKLDVSIQMNNSIDYEFEEKDFRLSMLEDQMASEKLSEGITGFSKAIEELEELLLKRYSEIKNHKLISAN